MKKLIFSLLVFSLGWSAAMAQSVGINSDGSTPHASAILDVSSTTKGFLAPRMTTSQRAAITSPATGLLVYQTDGTPGYYYFDGSVWVPIGSETAASIKSKLGITTLSGSNTGDQDIAAMTHTNRSALDAVSGTNTGDQTLPTLSSLGAVASNIAITGGTKTKVAYDAKGLVTAGADATTADIAASTNKNYVTDAQLTAIGNAGNTSGTNTGDNAVNSLYSGLTTNATHTGDVTGSAALTIADKAVTLAKMADMETSTVIYRKAASTGAPEVQTLSTLKSDLGLTGTNTGDQTNVTGTALNVTGIVAIANGGTGATTAAGARTNLELGTAALANTGTGAWNVPVLNSSGKIESSLLNFTGLSYKGNQSLSGNPTVATETSGNYYIVSVAGNETGSGLAFAAGDWMISNGIAWQKIANTSGVASVAGKTGAVILAGSDITSGAVAIANGGTGATTAENSINALLPTQTSNSGKYLTTNGSNPSWATITASSGTVTSIAASGGTTGLSFSGGPVTTSGTLTMAGTLALANGGTGLTTVGTNGQVLASNGSVMAWTTPSSGGVTGVSGTAPIVSTGTTTPAISITAATTSAAGSMSATDKTKLDGIATAATNYTHPTGDGNLHVIATSTTNSGKVLTAGASAGSLSWTTPTSGTVTSVTGTSPISVATGTSTPVISLSTVPVASGGTGATTLTGYVSGNGTGAMTAATTIPGSAISGYLPVTAGGTGTTTGPTQGGVIYAISNVVYGSIGAGTSGQALLSGGTGAPTWSSNINGTAGNVSGTVAVANGGTGATSATVQGGVIYGSSTTVMASTVAGTSGQVLTSNGTSAPTWSSTLSGNAATATSATNLTGGSAGTIAYQTAAGATSQLTAGTSGYLLKSNGAAAPSWLSTLPVANGGTGTTNGSITGTTALTFAAGGTNQNVTLTPSGTGYTLLNGKVNIGDNQVQPQPPPYTLSVASYNSGQYTARISNFANSISAHGLLIRAGGNTIPFGATMIGFQNIDGDVIGSITQNAAFTVSYNTSSDRRLKNNIVNTHFGINDLMKIQVRDYVYKADAGKTLTTGFIAQELYDIFPNAVSKPAKAEDMWSVDYGKVTPLLVKAIQDQQATIEAQQKQINELKRMVEMIMKK